jgi:hypothetical protein
LPLAITSRQPGDVMFPATSSYSALVSLGLARYQPSSLPGLALSPAVRTDFVPLLPDGTLTITVAPDLITVRIDGLAHRGPRPNRVDAVMEQRVGPDVVSTGSPVTVGEDGLWRQVVAVSGPVNDVLRLPGPDRDGLRVRVRESRAWAATSPPTWPSAPSGNWTSALWSPTSWSRDTAVVSQAVSCRIRQVVGTDDVDLVGSPVDHQFSP